MYVKEKHKLGKSISIIYPGEYYVTDKDELIGTLLGSCVSVCLHDSENKVGGMNHFMLPGRIRGSDILNDDSAKYGIAAINRIIELMLKKGAKRENLTAKLFGGGKILNLPVNGNQNMIPADNIRVAKLLMELDDIPITAMDVGANYTRKIIFDAFSGKVYLRKITKSEVTDLIVTRDEKFFNRGELTYGA